MRYFFMAIVAVVLLSACQRAPLEKDDILVVRCGALIDGLADEVMGPTTVLIRNQRIEQLLSIHAPASEDSEVLNLTEYVCLPGLIDTHTHLALNHDDSGDLSIYYRRSLADATAITLNNANITLQAGFTTVRNVGDYFPEAILKVRERIRQGTAPGPRIQTAGSYLTIPGGGGDLVVPGRDEAEIPAGIRIGVARGPEQFAAATQRVLDDGADLVKIIASGAVFAYGGVPGSPEMTPEEIKAVVEVAHAHGVKVTAHAHGAQSIKDAILAGVDSIEHASFGDDEAIALALEHGVAFSMDVYNGTFTAEVGAELGYPEEFMRKNDETTEAQRVVFEKAYAAGVPILYGTDAGVLPHGMNARQFEVMVRRGMAPMDAIRSATSVAAEHMGLAADVGAIEPGRFGDLIAVKTSPLDDITTLQDIPVVVKGGSIVKQVTKKKRQFADVVYHTGKVYTVNAEQPWAQAVAIRNGTITFVGSDDAVRAHIGPATTAHDLHGRLMLPGFQDAHVHPPYAKDIPSASPEERLAALEQVRDQLHSFGITSLQSAYANEPELEMYEQLDKMRKLNLRVVAALPWDADAAQGQIEAVKALRERFTQGNLRATSVELVVDGVAQGDTAELTELVSDLAGEGFQVHFHAMSDGAVRYALDAVEEANKRHGDMGLRHHLSHLQVVHPDDHARFAELGAVANFQPAWAYADEFAVDLTLPYISDETARWMYPIKSILDAGGIVAFGSDWSVSTVNPMPQIETAVTRVDADSHATEVLNPEQRITVAQAVEAFTLGSAYVNHQDETTGSIEVGKLADLVVLDQNIFEIEAQRISDTKVVLTLFGGKPVYGKPADL